MERLTHGKNYDRGDGEWVENHFQGGFGNRFSVVPREMDRLISFSQKGKRKRDKNIFPSMLQSRFGEGSCFE